MDVDSSSNNSLSSGSLHPRRPPAHKSVSLLHSPRAVRARSHEPGVGPIAQPPEPIKRPSSSPSSLKPLVGKDDSGESSNAEKWFEKSNNHASRNSTSFVDNSPPFFLQNSSSDETPPEGAAARARNHYLGVDPSPGSLPLRTGLLHLGTDNSSTEDFRSVIDDLTIENKKLKRKLKTYEKLHDSHLKDQKLFEVRVHGLPTSKKKELEEMLRQFALGLNQNGGAELANNMFGSMAPSLTQQKSGGTSSTSNPFADSAYASASASGQGSSNQSLSDTKKKPISVSAARHRQQHIQTYLHDIPEGLLPRHPSAMTEKAKKKMIVRRLEQIFAGKGAVAGNNQPQQQQEVSQLAARMDRTAMESSGGKMPLEGLREALIMSEIIANREAQQMAVKEGSDKGKKNKESPKSAKKSSHEQRPTRPLDLDPYRAQIPAENMQYMRHLGFSPPGAETMSPPEEGHGWIYLNLLANMAQLHTINVTPEFVRKAIQDVSKKLELSDDGRKVRWKGGRSVTKTSSDGGTTPSVGGATGSNAVSSERGSPRKRLKVSQQGSSSGSRPSRSEIERQEQKLAYTPLFYHRTSQDDSELTSSDEEDTLESAFPIAQAGDSSGMTSSGIKTTSTKRKKARENGPIIFYNNAKFCTDLSGDAKTEEAMLYNAFLYHSIASQPVGTPYSGSSSPASETKGPLASTNKLPEPMDLDDNPIPADQEIKFPDASPLSSQKGKDRKAIQFEVSGLGGVYPADNFAINVESRHARTDDVMAPTEHRSYPSRHYPDNIAKLLQRSDDAGRLARMAYHKELVDARTENLPPSQLPDASCFMPAGDTTPEDDEMSDAGDAMSESPLSADAPPPSAAPQPIDMEYASSSDEDGDDEDEESESGSLDLLATARQIDPEAIRRSEREYDADMADRLAEEIPAGSSAATAGGGSGFASPEKGVDREEWEAAKREIREKLKGVESQMMANKKAGVQKEARSILKRRRSEAPAKE
ncbi:putative frequency clock protein [Elsinoe fawcettii]|nr:putative frequency clock protein [Elsinoe fawcettii]